MKPFIKFKNDQWWVWSSIKASLDCLPQAKFDHECDANKYTIKKASPKLQAKLNKRKAILKNWAMGFNK